MSLVILPISYPALGQLGMGRHGKKIYQEMDFKLTNYNSCTPLSEEQFACVWSQTDLDGIRRVHLQIVSSGQRLSFPNNPPALSLNNHSDNAVICRGPNGGAYVAWTERRGDNQGATMLQRINSNGSPAWQQGGIEVSEITGLHRIYLSSEGNCFIEIVNYRLNDYPVFAYDHSGQAIDGWPLRDYQMTCLIPDNEGGFWFYYGGETNRLYRIDRNGGIVGGSPLVLEPPAGGYNVRYGIQISADHIFTLWSAGIRQPVIVGVYDFSGEVQRFDTFIDAYNDEAANFISLRSLVTPDNRLVAVYNHIDEYLLEYAGWMETPMYAPRVICYAPFERNRFPFGRNMEIYIGYRDSWAEYFQIYLVGENYLFYDYTTYPFDRDGRRLWQFNPPTLGPLYPIGEKAWVFGGSIWGTPYFAYQINDRAVRENEAEIAGLIPHQRERGLTTVFPTANGGCDILMVDKFRGLAGQYINSEGRLSENLAAGVLEPLWRDTYCNKYSSGSFSNSHWAAVRIGGGRNINLVVSDDDGNVQVSVSHDFSHEGIGITDYTSPVGNGRDRLLAVYTNLQDDRIRLIEFNTSGEVTRNINRDLGLPKQLGYWPGQGWLYFDRLPNSDYWRASLIDDDLNIRWQRELNYQSHIDDFNKPDQLAFHDTTAIVYWFDRRSRMIRAEVGASSTPLRSDSLYFFSDEFIDRNSVSKLRIASDGGWWLLMENSGRLQKIADDGTRVYGDSGLVLIDHILHYRLLPDTEGGAWVIWRVHDGHHPERKIRVIHFDANGEKVSENYPDGGLDIFDNGEMSLEGAAFDPNTGNVWVIAERWERSNGDVVSKELWVQLVGENVVGVPGVDPTLVYSFSLNPVYPNPFNVTTTIPFSLQERAAVSLIIYDVNGQQVQDISPLGSFDSGRHNIIWNARTLPTGIYFIRFESDGRSAIRRAILLK